MSNAPRTTPDWEQIDTVLLDMDGTLLDLRFDRFFWHELVPERYGQRHGLSAAEALARLQPVFAAREGTLDWYCLDYWTRELGLDLAALKREVAARIAILPSVVEFLEAVRAMRKRVVLVTNAHRTSLALKIETTGLGAYLDARYSSHDFGLPKEDPAFWRCFHEEERFDRERTLLADDSVQVLRAARLFGLRYVYEMRRPDSTGPLRDAGEFASVEGLAELIPAAPARRA
jgi:putative hydrolase of the HAD superfamily